MDYVNDIIVRQNGLDPVSTFETFHTETSARRVLKDLLMEFQLSSDELKKKQSKNEDDLRYNKSAIENIRVVISKLQL
jgi:hypothetical protein